LGSVLKINDRSCTKFWATFSHGTSCVLCWPKIVWATF
jgi:hypothetical protein